MKVKSTTIALLLLSTASIAAPVSKATNPAIVALASTSLHYDDGLRKWQPRDSIPLRHYGSTFRDSEAVAHEQIAVPSPNGKYFYVLSNRGDLNCDCNIRTLEVFESSEVSAWVQSGAARPARPEPIRVVQRLGSQKRVTSVQGRDPIEIIGWRAKENDLIFLGSDETHDQIYRLRPQSGVLEALTKDPFNKEANSISTEGNTVLYRREVPIAPSLQPVYPAVFLPRNRDGELSYPYQPMNFRAEYVVQKHGRPLWVLPLKDIGGIIPLFDPSGEKAILFDLNRRRDINRARLLLLDVTKQTLRELTSIKADFALHGSVAASVKPAIWSKDGSQVILVNTGLPSSAGTTKDKSAYIIVYNITNGQWSRVEMLVGSGPMVSDVQWVQDGRQLLVERQATDGTISGTLYSLDGDHWAAKEVPVPEKAKAPPARLAGGLSVALRQSANEQPMLVASAQNREGFLSDPDPALNGLGLAKVEPYSWQMPDGSAVQGSLTLPPEPAPPGGYPLVIQVDQDGVSPDTFMPDGNGLSGYARQALVSRGMAVLSLAAEKIWIDGSPSSESGRRFVDQVDAAVDKLTKGRLVSRDKVGLFGFSATGYLAYYAATHPGKTSIRAVETIDSTTHSLFEYLLSVAAEGNTKALDIKETSEGGNPWQNPSETLAKDPIMNSNHGDAAVLFTRHGMGAQPGRFISELGSLELSTIAAMERNRRAFEYIFLPGAGHGPLLPRERLLLMTANVDWMSFWLQGYEDPAPEKVEQYARWRFLKARNEQRIADRIKANSPPAKTQ